MIPPRCSRLAVASAARKSAITARTSASVGAAPVSRERLTVTERAPVSSRASSEPTTSRSSRQKVTPSTLGSRRHEEGTSAPRQRRYAALASRAKAIGSTIGRTPEGARGMVGSRERLWVFGLVAMTVLLL
ncbi:MAG: hypothetical protein IPN17_23800 [Deltaproteobacteria bacterium]|nr:hypothetical protein [Deltaproteobacteria bacterium]